MGKVFKERSVYINKIERKGFIQRNSDREVAEIMTSRNFFYCIIMAWGDFLLHTHQTPHANNDFISLMKKVITAIKLGSLSFFIWLYVHLLLFIFHIQILININLEHDQCFILNNIYLINKYAYLLHSKWSYFSLFLFSKRVCNSYYAHFLFKFTHNEKLFTQDLNNF